MNETEQAVVHAGNCHCPLCMEQFYAWLAKNDAIERGEHKETEV